MSEAILKPCPFCEGQGRKYRNGDIACSNRFCAGFTMRLCGVKAWNTRADLPPTPADPLDDPRVKALVEALRDIARQKKTDELETEYDVECASFEDGFDLCVDRARAALAAITDRDANT